jgi:hypothetical protein
MPASDRIRAAVHRLRARLTPTEQRVVVVVLAALLVVVPVSLLARSGVGEPTAAPGSPRRATTTTTTTKPLPRTEPAPRAKFKLPKPFSPLTGLPGTFEGRIDRPALVVKIDNVPNARPQAGLRLADIVIEEPVEGNFTRLAAVFHSRDAGLLGPVRSARTSDLELFPLFGRVIFASSGGNAGVIPQIQRADVVDIGDHVTGAPYYRIGGRSAPHNLFTSTGALYGAAPEQPRPPKQVFRYRRPNDELPKSAFRLSGVALRFGGGEISRFHWDPDAENWPRSTFGAPHVDANGQRIAPKNVVVLEVDYDYSNQLGRSVPHAVVTGRGQALVLTAGKAIRGTWVRPTLLHPLRLVMPGSKQQIELTRGQTFIELPVRGGWSFL